MCSVAGVVGKCGRGEHHSVHHQHAAESRPGAAHGFAQQPAWRRRPLRSQVQHSLWVWKLLRGRQGRSGRSQGTFYMTHITTWTCINCDIMIMISIFVVIRASSALHRPSSVSSKFQRKQAAPRHCCSTSAFSSIKVSSTSTSRSSCVDLSCNKVVNSSLKSGSKRTK